VTVYGCKTQCDAWSDPDGPQFVGNELRDCHYVGFYLGFDTPLDTPDDACFLNAKHVITAWGDDRGDEPDVLNENPTTVYVTDSDQSTGENHGVEEYDYTWDTDRWYIDYSKNDEVTQDPYIWNVVTLSEPDTECDGQGQDATGSYDIENDEPAPAVGLEYFVGTDTRICTYTTDLDWETGDEVPRIVKYHEEDPFSREYLEVIWDLTETPVDPGEWVTITTDFLLPQWNAVEYWGVKFLYALPPAEGDAKASIGWNIETLDDTVPGTGGYVIGAFDVYADETGSNKLGEYRLMHEFGIVDPGSETHDFTIDSRDESPVWIGGLRFGRSSEPLDADQLWNFDCWVENDAPVQPLTASGSLDWVTIEAGGGTADIDFGTKNRYLSIRGVETGPSDAVRVTFASIPGYEYAEGRTMWVREPSEVTESSGSDGPGPEPTFWAATLGCTPFYTDWSQYGIVEIYDDAILPGSVHDVQSIHEGCPTSNQDSYSNPVSVQLSAVGDIVGFCTLESCSSPQGVVDFVDINAVVEKFKNEPFAVPKTVADLANSNISNPLPDRKVDFVDIALAVDAFRGAALPPPGPPATDPCAR
jgi:hypothetical protein